VSHRWVDELDCGFGWLQEERMTRTSHALVEDARVWLLDPLDVPGLDDRVSGLGEPAGVVQLLDRHNRDCASIAARLAVPHHFVPDEVPDSPFEVVRVLRWRRWREDALWWPERRILVTADAVGTNRLLAGRDRAGVHPLLRLVPPRVLGRYDPRHLLVGHGEGLHGEEAAPALQHALATALTGIPRWLGALLAGP
jgi:hypothetical protein